MKIALERAIINELAGDLQELSAETGSFDLSIEGLHQHAGTDDCAQMFGLTWCAGAAGAYR